MGGHDDPRMRGFRRRWAVEDVIGMIDERVSCLGGSEAVAIAGGAGRVLAGVVVVGAAVPGFDRAAMDGYAVRGEETYGADGGAPAGFRVVGESRPGRGFAGRVGEGEAVRVATGAPMPEGADTVVMVEVTRRGGDWVEVVEGVPVGKHVGRRGEDFAEGVEALGAGRVLRPQDLGVLSALGVAEVEVRRSPVVAVVVTGDELLAAGSVAEGVRIADANSVMVAALVVRDGGEARVVGPLADDREGLRRAIAEAAGWADVVMVSGGSSTGPEDHAPGLVAELGELVAHGVALRPASPTGLGFVEGVPVLLMPGNPVSCLCAYDFFGGRIVRRLGGRPGEWSYRRERMVLGRKLVSELGRVDYARVRIDGIGRAVPVATGGASLLSSVSGADGFVVVPAGREGYAEGEEVEVFHYDSAG